MIIHDVKLKKLEEIKPGTLVDGLPMPTQPETFYFDVDVEGEDANVTVPNDPANSHYWLVKEWFDAQETAPFEFIFEQMAKPDFAETVYPPEPETVEEPLPETLLPAPDENGEVLPSTPEEAARIQPPTEPETLMPK